MWCEDVSSTIRLQPRLAREGQERFVTAAQTNKQKLVDWGKECLKIKQSCSRKAERNKKCICYCKSAGRCLATFLGRGTSKCRMVTWKTDSITTDHLLSLRFHSWAWCHMVWKIPIVHLGHHIPCTLPVTRGQSEKWVGLDAVQALLRSNSNIGLCSTLFCSQIQKNHRGCYKGKNNAGARSSAHLIICQTVPVPSTSGSYESSFFLSRYSWVSSDYNSRNGIK